MGLAYIPVLCIYLMSKLRWKWKWHPGNLPKICSSAKSLLSCPTLCDPIDGSPPDSPVPGILRARTLEWVAISFSNAWKWKVKVKSLSRVWPSATPWTAAFQAPPSMGFSRQEYWSGVPSPSPRCNHKVIQLVLISYPQRCNWEVACWVLVVFLESKEK